MFAPVVLAAALVAAPRTDAPASHCPNATASAAAVVTGPRERCAALDVSGTVGASGLVLDPAFGRYVGPADFDRPANSGRVLLEGFTTDGRILFAFPFDAAGAFHLTIPIDARMTRDLARLRLSANGTAVERTGDTGPLTPDAEILEVDSSHVLIAWDSTRFPAIRVLDGRTGRVLGYGSGTGTFTQLTVDTTAARLVIDFSNGVRSALREFAVFGR